MWMVNYFGVNAIFDIRGILLAFVLLVGDIGLMLLSERVKLSSFLKLSSVVMFNVVFAVLVAKYDISIAIETIVLAFFWTAYILCMAKPAHKEQTSKVSAISFSSLMFCIMLLILDIGVAAPARYDQNVITLEPEVETTFYCIDTNELISEDIVLEGDVITIASRSFGKALANDLFAKYILIDGEKDYVKKTISTYYTEDRNIEPPIRSISKVENVYILYIGKDK